MRYENVDVFNSTRDTAQFELARIPGNARHARLRHAARLFNEQAPWLVIGAIGALLKRVDTAALSSS